MDTRRVCKSSFGYIGTKNPITKIGFSQPMFRRAYPGEENQREQVEAVTRERAQKMW
jgi:hypothetical protein